MPRQRSVLQRIPLAPVFAAMFGGAAAILVAATPGWLFEASVVGMGLDSLIDVARPPLGVKARVLAALLALVTVGGVIWGATALILRLVQAVPERDDEDDDALDLVAYVAPRKDFAAPRADLAPRRRPIFADRELGAPFMSDAALETAAPVTFTQELVGADPAPFEPAVEIIPEPVDPQLAVPLAIEEFDLPETPEEPLRLSGETEIEALIRRLEAGLAKRGDTLPPEPGAPAATPAANPRDWLVRGEDSSDDRSDDDSVDDGSTRALATLRRMAH